MNNDVKLEPCPFCGGEALLENTITQASIMCCDCPCVMRRDHTTRIFDDGTHRAIAAWNTRTAAQPEREAVLEEADATRVARAMDPPLWSDDEEAARMAASPLQVCYARERSLERARLFLTEYTALTTPAPAVSTDEIVAVLERCSQIVDRNLYHQSEKVEDVPVLLRRLAARLRGEG